MRKILVFSLLALQALAAGAEVINIDTREFARLLNQGVPVIDVRTAPEWGSTGIVAGSHLLTYFDQNGQADPAAWLEKARIVAKPGEPVILICRSGNRTRAVSRFLSDQAGYARVYAVTGGINAWSDEGRPLVPATQAIAACRGSKRC